MVTRLYFCKDCDHEFETVQPMHEDLLKVCPECEGVLVQDLCGVHLGIKQYNTVGSVAEKNARDLGHYGRQKREKEIKEEQEGFSKRRKEVLAKHGLASPETKTNGNVKITDPPKAVKEKIAQNDVKAVKDYIMTGKV